MAGLSSLLHIGSSGLFASQQGVRAASDNITNVDTPGFNRRESIQRAQVSYAVGGRNQGTGVRFEGTQRVVDEVLERRLQSAETDASYAEARSSALQQAEAVFVDFEGVGVTGALNELFTAFDQLAGEPQDTGARQRVLAGVEQLASSVNFVASELESQRSELTRKLEDQVQEINQLSGQVADLNIRIGGSNPPPPDLLDQRDALVRQMSNLVGVNVVEVDQRLSVSLRGSGFSLVTDGVVQPLAVSVSGGQAVISGDRGDLVEEVTSSLVGGAISGTLEARDNDLQTAIASLDQFAFDFATEVNALHRAGFGLDGVGGRDLMAVPATSAGAAGAMAVDASVRGQPDRIAAAVDSALVPGDNRNAVALSELRDRTLAGGSTPSESVRSVVTDFGNRLAEATGSMEARVSVRVRLEELRESISGVNIDEEMTRLLQYRQSYSAAARVVRTADELMQEVIALKR